MTPPLAFVRSCIFFVHVLLCVLLCFVLFGLTLYCSSFSFLFFLPCCFLFIIDTPFFPGTPHPPTPYTGRAHAQRGYCIFGFKDCRLKKYLGHNFSSDIQLCDVCYCDYFSVRVRAGVNRFKHLSPFPVNQVAAPRVVKISIQSQIQDFPKGGPFVWKMGRIAITGW